MILGVHTLTLIEEAEVLQARIARDEDHGGWLARRLDKIGDELARRAHGVPA
jgi:hypothetical protein